MCYFLISHTPVEGESVATYTRNNDGIKHFDDIDGKYVVEQKTRRIGRASYTEENRRRVVGALLWTVAICGLLTVHFSHGGNNNIMWNLCVAIRS